jgi:hypothetical protein
MGPEAARNAQIAAALAIGIAQECDLLFSWAAPAVRIEFISGTNKERRGHIKTMKADGSGGTMVLDGAASANVFHIKDVHPERPSTKAGSFVRMLTGLFAGKYAETVTADDDDTLTVNFGDVVETVSINMLVAAESNPDAV